MENFISKQTGNKKKAFPAASHPRYANTFQYLQTKNAPVHEDRGTLLKQMYWTNLFLAFSDASSLLLKFPSKKLSVIISDFYFLKKSFHLLKRKFL